ncbi:MAG: PIN domain-containing protein [Vicinamibacterales bacterium]
MSIPTAVFLDTSILDSQQYNFQSTAFSTFVPACAKRSLKLLLPDPTEREIKRHMKERTSEALSALEGLRRKVPFLGKWKGLAPQFGSPQLEEFDAQSTATDQWQAFLKQFAVVRLGYQGLDVAKVMQWYDKAEAPFKEGKKRKEFTDAFAIQMLDAYAQKAKIYIAVVSADEDFKLACQRYSALLYFKSLPRLTELLLSDVARVEKLRLAIDANMNLLNEAIADEMQDIEFHHHSQRIEVHGYNGVDVESVDVSIVAVGDDECTIVFDTLQGIYFDMRWEDDTDDGPKVFRRNVKERVELSGTAKVSFVGDEVSEVSLLSFDQKTVALSEGPYGGIWW